MAKKKEMREDRLETFLAGDLLKSIKKKHGSRIIAPSDDFRIQSVPRIKTGIFFLDYALGGGFPAGRVNIVWGHKSTGKSVICMRGVAGAQRVCANCYTGFLNPKTGETSCTCKKFREHICAYIDVEGCVAWDQEILDPLSGFVGSVEDYMTGEDVRHTLSWDDGNIRPVEVPRRIDSGIQDTVLVSTRTTSLRCTPNHPVLVWRDGGPRWVEAADISPGECLARPWRVSFEGQPTGIEAGDAELLGMLAGDGSFSQEGSIIFTNTDDEVWSRIEHLVKKWGIEVNRYDGRHGRLIVPDMEKGDHRWGSGNPLRRWVASLGLIGVRTPDKRIVEDVLRGPLSIVAAALSGLWMTDGGVNPARPALAYTSTSRVLAVQVRWMLSRIGVLGRLSTSHDGCSQHRPWHVVTINGRANLRRFRENVQLYGRKGELLEAWCCSQPGKDKPTSEYLLPGYVNSKHYRRESEWLNESDEWWDEVITVENAEPTRCFDAGVPRGHSWTASDVLVHNTWDQEWARLHGVNTDRLLRSVPEYAEQTLDIAEALLRSGDVDLIVIDSLAFLTPSKEIEESTAKALQAEQARVLGRGIRKFGSALNYVGNRTGRRPTILFTNQVRMKVGVMFGSPEIQPGGHAPGFSATTETKTYGGKYSMDEVTGRPTHVDLQFRVEKNKSAGAKIEGVWRLMLADTETKKKGEVLEESAMVDMGIRIGLATVKGSSTTCFGETYKGKSLLVKALMTNPELKKKYADQLMMMLMA